MTQGRFTLRGGPAVEEALGALVRRAGEVITARLPGGEPRALVLIGGYGRGEGGVERRGAVERPHNNLDFLVVLERPAPPGLKERLDRALEPLRRWHGVGIDLGLITARALRRTPCRILWYDARHGHKTILGDAAFLPSLTRFRCEAIPPEDVRNLMVNRGTLLVINEALWARGAPDEETRRTILRHTAKAIIGYGDALLFFRGQYDWSYAEKRRRMAVQHDVPEALRRLYDQASAFRFEPEYDGFAPRELGPWMEAVCGQLADVHLLCEAIRLSAPGLHWGEYARLALRRALRGNGFDARLWMRRLRNLLRFRPALPPGFGVVERLGLRLGGPAELLGLVFPFVAFGVGTEADRELARRLLDAAGPGDAGLRRAYLQRWGELGDANFGHLARKYGLLPSEPAEVPA